MSDRERQIRVVESLLREWVGGRERWRSLKSEAARIVDRLTALPSEPGVEQRVERMRELTESVKDRNERIRQLRQSDRHTLEALRRPLGAIQGSLEVMGGLKSQSPSVRGATASLSYAQEMIDQALEGEEASEITDEPRCWTLIDQSEDYRPHWKVVNEGAPAAREYAELVEVVEAAGVQPSGEGR